MVLRALVRTARASLLELRPDGIVVTDEEMLWAGVQARRRLGVPLLYDSPEHWTGMIARDRPLEAMLYGRLEHLAAPHIEHVYTVSAGIARHWQALGCAATVIYNSRDLGEIAPHEIPRPDARRRLGLPDGSFVLGYTGSVSREQGLETCIAALVTLPAHVWLVVLGGPRDALRRLESLAVTRGVRDRFRALDAVPPDEAVRVQCAFDVGLAAVDGSGPNFDFRLPNKLFDYMALGLPVVVSDYPALRQLVVDEVGFGLTARPGVAASVAAAVSQLMAEPALRTRMSAHARRAFERTYGGERQKERLRATHGFWRA
jgi:glycosyltransferase involved in cell wall biosynthesis